jgi:serine protease AprX
MDLSITTVKADAARRAFSAAGTNITWAVIDSGIDSAHPHFGSYKNLEGHVAGWHRDFTGNEAECNKDPTRALSDEFGHGTHVAGIIAGCFPRGDSSTDADLRSLIIAEHLIDENNEEKLDTRDLEGPQMEAIAPACKLVSLKVLGANGRGGSSNVIRALEYVRKELNGSGKTLQVHGVNVSLGYEFNPRWFACGRSPLCVEVNRLVRSGVVVVVAAGNTGWGTQSADQRVETKTGLALTINDPGNAEMGITVGSTHRNRPFTYGVSYYSSKGPTGDGRSKPDLVAPGERITSCAAGKKLAQMQQQCAADWTQPMVAAYIDDSGTSMAAPHVSGAIAAFLSIRSEFIGEPEKVKQIFLNSATSLDREPYFQGHGLVDLMRAIQSV